MAYINGKDILFSPNLNVNIDNAKLQKVINRTITEINEMDLLGVTKIGAYAFSHCTALSMIGIPHGVKSIGRYAFYGCGIERLSIPDSVETLGDWCFSYMPNLKRLRLSKNITAIPEGALSDCINLMLLEIPASVKSIGGYQNCGSSWQKTTIVVKPTTPPTLAANVRWGDYNHIERIIVPSGTLTTYASATNWASLADLMEEDAPISSTWVFNDDTTELHNFLEATCLCTWEVKFTSNGVSYEILIANGARDLDYCVSRDAWDVGDLTDAYEDGWTNDVYKTITFENELDIPSDLLSYLKKMATKIS